MAASSSCQSAQAALGIAIEGLIPWCAGSNSCVDRLFSSLSLPKKAMDEQAAAGQAQDDTTQQ